jgi:UDP-2,3-diacylglucosamine pyrophosphatase LpxH
MTFPPFLAALLILSPGFSRAETTAREQLEDLQIRFKFDPPALPRLPEPAELISPWSRDAQMRGLPRIDAPGETVRFVVLGDIEPGRFWFTRAFPPKRDAFERQMRTLQEEEPAFVLQLGDVVSRGTPENYAKLEETLDRVAYRPFFPVIGNHDRPNTHGRSSKALFNSVFGDGDFFFDLGDCRIVLLDNSNWELTESQLAWLDRVLDTNKRTVVSMHIPPTYLRGRFSKPGKEPRRKKKDRIKKSVGWFKTGALEFSEIVSRRRVDRVYVGHLHALGYADYSGVRYVLSGGGGSPLYRVPGKIPGKKVSHYIVVEAGPAGITERIETLKGDTLSFKR